MHKLLLGLVVTTGAFAAACGQVPVQVEAAPVRVETNPVQERSETIDLVQGQWVSFLVETNMARRPTSYDVKVLDGPAVDVIAFNQENFEKFSKGQKCICSKSGSCMNVIEVSRSGYYEGRGYLVIRSGSPKSDSSGIVQLIKLVTAVKTGGLSGALIGADALSKQSPQAKVSRVSIRISY